MSRTPSSRTVTRLGAAARRTLACAIATCLAGTAAVHAQTAGTPNPIDHFARQWLDQALAGSAEMRQGTPLRPEIVIGSLDPRLQLAPCGRIEPYLPSGTQLWGKSRIGLKCMEGPVAWNVFLPVTIKAWGPAWVIKRSVAANTTLTSADAELVPEVDWADSRYPIVALPEQWVGMQAAFTLSPGQALRQNAVRPPQAFAAGSQVKVVAAGQGFTLSAAGVALQPGQVGQVARIKLESGKIVTGTVRPEGTVLINI